MNNGQQKSTFIRTKTNKELIETLVLEPPHVSGSGILKSRYDCLQFSHATKQDPSSHLLTEGTSLQKPCRMRVISFENQQELMEKLNRVMMDSFFQPELDANPEQHHPKSSATKHCIVDLDEAFDRYPPIPPSLFTSSWDSSAASSGIINSSSNITEAKNRVRDFKDSDFSSSSPCHHKIGVIPEPSDGWDLDTAGGMVQHQIQPTKNTCDINTSNMSYHKKKKSIERESVLRTRCWGRCMRIPSHLLRPPMISRQRLSE